MPNNKKVLIQYTSPNEESLDFGTGANALLQIGADGKLPALDGSNLTGIGGGSSVDNSLHFTAAQCIPNVNALAAIGQTTASVSITNVGGTNATLANSTGIYGSYTTAATLNAVCKAFGLNIGYIQHISNIYSVFSTGSSVAVERIWVGAPLLTGVVDQVDSPLANSSDFIGFRYSTNAGDTTWKIVTTSVANATELVQDTGVTVAANTRYTFRVKVLSATSLQFYINGTSVGTASGLSIPQTGLALGFSCTTLETVAKTFLFSREAVEYSV